MWQAEWNKAQLIARSEAEALAAARADADADEAGGARTLGRSCDKANTVRRCHWRKLLMLSQCCSFSQVLVWNARTRTKSLVDFEFRLREAEAYECLTTMCRLLIYRSHLYKFKDKHVTGQMMSTRARSTVSNVLSNIDEAATRY